ncbi:MAG: hypothetical protein P1U40_09190 [Coxiellaceae bacterium]|nr:hypothetical protein [Coxiellaceae bacterium]
MRHGTEQPAADAAMLAELGQLNTANQHIAELSEQYRLRHDRPKPAIIRAMNQLTERLFLISGCPKLPTRQRLTAVIYRLRQQIRAHRNTVTLVRWRPERLIPDDLLVLDACLDNILSLTQPASTQTEEQTSYINYRRLTPQYTGHVERLATTKISFAAENAAERAVATNNIQSFFCNTVRYRNFAGRIAKRLQEAESDSVPTDATPDTNDILRARYMMFHDEVVEGEPYISLTEADACLTPGYNPVTLPQLQRRFAINASSHLVYSHKTIDGIVRAATGTRIPKDPTTRQPLQKQPIRQASPATAINVAEINRLLNLQHLQHPDFDRDLQNPWRTFPAINFLCQLHPAYLQPQNIPMLNQWGPAFTWDISHNLNTFAKHFSPETVASLLKICQRQPIDILQMFHLTPQLTLLQRSIGNQGFQQLIQLCADRDIDVQQLFTLHAPTLRIILNDATTRGTPLEQSIRYFHQRAQHKVNHYTNGLNGCFAFWRNDFKHQRLAHYQQLQTTTQTFAPLFTP